MCIDFEEGKGFKFSQDETAIAIGVRKGSKLKDDINGALSTISGEDREKLMQKAVGGAIS